MEEALQKIQQQPQGTRTEAYLALLRSTLEHQNEAPHMSLSHFVQSATSESAGLIVSRQVLSEFVQAISTISDSELKQNAIEAVLPILQPRTVTFEEQIVSLRLMLADLLEAREEWMECAKVLMAIPLESGHRSTSDEFKLAIYVRIVRLLLEEDDAVSAESYFNRATSLIHTTRDKETQLHYKLAQARIFDSQRKFNEAGSRYHEISYVTELDKDDRLQALGAAVTCAILAPAGPARSRLLATLYRDERTQDLEQYPILSATFLDQIIRPSLIAGFEASLKPHQLAKLAALPQTLASDMSSADEPIVPGAKRGPETVLDRAVMEHNLLSASRIYSNITFSGLGALLSLTPWAAEAMARTMIQQGRLKASIDQIGRVIMFDPTPKELEGAVSNVAKAAGASGEQEEDETETVHADETVRWDLSIRKTTQAVEDLALRASVLMSATVGA